MANLNTYRALVQNEFDDTSARAQAVIDRAIKDTYQEIIRYASKFLVSISTDDTTVTAGTADYASLSDYIDIISVHYKNTQTNDFTRLKPLRWDDYLNYYINALNSEPVGYVKQGRTIKLMPAPDDAGTMRIHYTPVQAELDSDVVTSIIPDRYTQVVILGAMKRVLAYERTPDAMEYERMYRTALGEMMQEMGTQDEPVRPPLFGSRSTSGNSETISSYGLFR